MKPRESISPQIPERRRLVLTKDRGGVAKLRGGVCAPRTMDDVAHDMAGLYRTLRADAGI
jgi:hypothetical protein